MSWQPVLTESDHILSEQNLCQFVYVVRVCLHIRLLA